MRLELKRRIAKVFNQIFIDGVGDVSRWGQRGTVIKDMAAGLDVSAHTVCVISQFHSV